VLSAETLQATFCTAAAHEVDDFKAVAFVEERVGPAVARDDVTIQFDGDSIGLHAQGLDESRQGEWGTHMPEVPFIAVNV